MKHMRDSDWSVTVWGAEGEVTITHSKAGVVSDTWPIIDRDAGFFDWGEPGSTPARDLRSNISLSSEE